MKTPLLKTTFAAALAVLCLVVSAQAATIAYWRFEGDTNDASFLADSSGNGHTLTKTNSPTATTPLPSSGNGSNFFNPIPQTGSSNIALASTSDNNGFFAADDVDFAFTNTFTVELMFNAGSVTGATEYFVGQWGTTANRAWGLGLTDVGSDVHIRLALNNGTSSTAANFTSLSIAANTDYYIALTYDNNASADNVTLYYQDLTNSGALTSITSNAWDSVGSLQDSGNVVRVGSLSSGTTNDPESFFVGQIDEVRLSNTVLTESQLLAIPEPSSAAMLLGGLAALAVLRRRRRS